MSDLQTLLLTETGVEHLPGGAAAVNVGPIVRALKFLTEGRGDDRGTDEAGNPLPDLMSLAFAVIEAIIVGGRKAEYFRQVMRDLEAQDSAGRSALALAREARKVERAAPRTALDHAAERLEDLLAELGNVTPEQQPAQEAAAALEAFRAFGAERWLSASAQLLVALSALNRKQADAAIPAPKPRKRRAAPSAKRSAPKPAAPATKKKRSKTPTKAARKPSSKPRKRR